MIKEVIKFFILLFCICSCTSNGSYRKSNSKSDSTLYELNINPEKLDKVLLSQIADKIEYVILETNPNSSIGTIDKIICRDSLIFISDIDNTESVYCFNRKGRFKFKVSSKGRGPQEYIKLEDFSVDFDTKRLILYDGGTRSLLFYSFNGEFLSSKKTNIYLSHFEAISKKKYIYFSGYLSNPYLFKDNNYKVFICDDENEVKAKYLPFPANSNNFLNEKGITNNISSTHNGVYIYPHYEKIIYRLQGNELNPYLKISFEDKTIPNNFIEVYTQKEQEALLKEGKFVLGLESFQIVNNWLIGSFAYKARGKIIICNTLLGSINVTKMVNNDLDSFPISLFPPFFTDGKSMICIIEPYMIEKISQVVKTIPKDLQGIEEIGNPVLQFIKLK